ncbi:MAG: hypothetical protein KDA25_07620 [Phycisphaerales bacterium]|nr:hypothetical protein [Phycisphaerales bacterium]
MSRLRPYRVTTGRSASNYHEQVASNYASTANSFAYYTWIVDELLAAGQALVPVSAIRHEPPGGRRHSALRHDIDADPIAAVRCSRHLARLGVAGSFYLLHTAPYYGDVHDGVFVRNPAVIDWVRAMIVAGSEIGLHIDPFGLMRDHGMDGVEAVKAEIHWLRTQTANVTGTVSHNSAAVNGGAENYEVFARHVLLRRKVRRPDRTVLPLGVLQMSSLGLDYEGTCARPHERPDRAAALAFLQETSPGGVRDAAWMRRYLVDNPACGWDVECQCWLIGRDEWVVGGRPRGEALFESSVSGGRMLELVRGLPARSRTLFVVHPEYVRLP